MAQMKQEYILKAVYEGKGEIGRLRDDLNGLGKIEAIKKLESAIKDTESAIEGAEKKAAALKSVMESGGVVSESAAGKYANATASVDKLGVTLDTQKSKFAEYVAKLKQTETALGAAKEKAAILKTAMDGNITEKSTAEYVKAATKVDKLGSAFDKQTTRIDAYALKLQKTETTLVAAKEKVVALNSAMTTDASRTASNNYTKAAIEVKNLSNALDKQNATLKKNTADLKANGVNVTNLASEEKRLALASQETGKMWAARQALGVRSHRDIRDEVSKLTLAYTTLKTSGTASALEIFQAKQRLKEKTRELTDTNLTWGASFGKVQASVVALAGVGYGLIKTFKEFAGFETGMAEVNTLLDVSTERFSDFKKETKDVVGDLPQQSADLTKALYDIISAGVELDQSTKVLELSAKAATAGVTETKVAVGIGVGAMNAYGKTVDELEGIYDTLFNTVKFGVTTFPELAQSLGEVLPTARAAHVDLNNVGAAIAALTKSGIKTPQAATALRGAILAMAAPTTESKKKFEELGITWEGLLPTLEAIQKKGLSIDQMRMLIPDMEAAKGILSLTQNLDEFRSILGSMDEAGGSMEGAYQKMADTPDKEIKMMLKSISELGVSIGQLASLVILPAAKTLGFFADAINDAPAPIKIIISLLGAAATGALLWKLGLSQAAEGVAMLIAQVSSSAVVISAYTGTVAAARTGMLALTTAMATNPVTASILVALALAAAAWALFGKSSLQASKDHAQAAKEIGAGRLEIDKEITALEKLRATLDDTAPGSAEHIKAERELARLLPNVNLAYDEQGRLIGKVSDATSENSKKLDEHIRLLKEQSGISLGLQLEQQVNSYQKASQALDKYKGRLSALFGITADGNGAASSRQEFNLWLWKTIGLFKGIVTDGAKVEANLGEQKKAYDDLLDSMSKTGMTAEQVSTFLDKAKVSAELKSSIIADYKKLGGAIGDVTEAAEDSAKKQKDLFDKVTGEIKQKYVTLAQDVKRILGEIASRQESLAGQLREIGRSGMSDYAAWTDLKKEADEYYAAAQNAATAGNFDESVRLADIAREKYASLNEEVKENGKVMVSAEEARQAAAEGVSAAGELAIETLKREKAAAEDKAKDLLQQAGDFAKNWSEAWDTFVNDGKAAVSEMEKELDRLVEARRVELTVVSTESRQSGGIIGLKMQMGGGVGNLQHLAAGGSVLRNALNGLQLGGYGGGDRRLILGEDGEVMIRKESVRAAGARAALAFNSGRWDIVVAELISRFKMNIGDIATRRYGGFVDHVSAVLDMPQHLATGGMVVGGGSGMSGGTVQNYSNSLNVSFSGHVSPMSQATARDNARQIMSELKKLQRLSA